MLGLFAKAPWNASAQKPVAALQPMANKKKTAMTTAARKRAAVGPPNHRVKTAEAHTRISIAALTAAQCFSAMSCMRTQWSAPPDASRSERVGATAESWWWGEDSVEVRKDKHETFEACACWKAELGVRIGKERRKKNEAAVQSYRKRM